MGAPIDRFARAEQDPSALDFVGIHAQRKALRRRGASQVVRAAHGGDVEHVQAPAVLPAEAADRGGGR